MNGYTASREWAKYASQKSATVKLEAGKRYYIEALHKEDGGGDNLAVAWQLPSGAKEMPIAGNRLSPIGSSTATTTPAPSPAPTPAPTPVATGKITREFWASVAGGNVGSIPTNTKPTSTTELSSFEAPSNVDNSYGQRISGFITAPETGLYTFWIAGDDHAELFLSSSEAPANKAKIAFVNGYTASREWAKYASQKSATVKLEAGKRYYIEALHKEDGGGDNLAVAWQLPSGAKEMPIAGNRLSPIGSTQTFAATQTAAAMSSEPFFAKATAYPNPFRDVVTLSLGSSEVELTQVAVLDQTGRVVYTIEKPELVNNELSINLADLKTGLYILKYTDATGKSNSIKLIKE
ncbi:PA14 domain-containing protein [Pontibacter rugosus]|uniref:PA14 domain-containing protein n=1 Tax=Pontibacter rugosus TaxID=1745966 RepID=A0ABW3SUR4_9BACT